MSGELSASTQASSAARRLLPLAAATAVLAVLACNLAGAASPPPPTTITTRVPVAAATLPPIATPTRTPVPPTPTATITLTPVPTAEPLFHLVYVDGGDAWYSDGVRPARRLTATGGISQVFITDDGQLAALLIRDPAVDTAELQVIRTDGSDRLTLLHTEDFDGLHPRDEFLLHITPYRLAFLPGTHTLLFNTRAVFEGPGLVKFDDLYALDCDSGSLTPLLPPGSGGDFWFSPDGRRLALIRPDSLGVVGSDGSNPRLQLLNYPPVITYSEYSFYPLPVWSPDSTVLRVAIPSQDPFAAPPGGEVWTIPADGSTPTRMRELSGDLFRPQAGAALISPDLAWIAFTRGAGGSQLVVVSLVDGAETVYDRGTIQWVGWAPDSRHFIYTRDAGDAMRLGVLDGAAVPLPAGTALRWLENNRYFYLSGNAGGWSIRLGDFEGLSTQLVSPAGDFISFDVAAAP